MATITAWIFFLFGLRKGLSPFSPSGVQPRLSSPAFEQQRAPFMDGKTPELGAAALVRLKAGGLVEWAKDEGPYAEAHRSLYLPIVPSPGAWVYCGGEAAVLPVGQLTFVNRRMLYSAINLGDHPVITLVCDVRAPDADDPVGEP